MTAPPWSEHLPDDVDAASLDLTRGGSLPAVWASRWTAHPDRHVLHDEDGWINAEQLHQRTVEVAARLAGRGLRRGDRVIISAASSVGLVCAHVACLGLGAVVVPTNAAYGRSELAHIVTDSTPTFAIVDDEVRARHIARIDASVVITNVEAAFDPIEITWPNVKPAEPAMIAYTSGTTGRPKGAVLSHANILSSVNALTLSWRWTSSDRLVLCLPLFHMHGLGVGLHGTLAAGASAVLQQQFDVDAVLDAVATHSASMFFGVPTMYHRIAQSPRAGELGRLRLMVSGSAPMDAELHRRLFELTGQMVLERYGMTETVMLVSNPFDGERRSGTVGKPLPGVDVRLVGKPSEVQVRGPNVFSGYWRHADANSSAFDDGWFRTGDIGSFDDDGYLTLAGRLKELIISGGFNVYPREVEDAIRSHVAVDDVAVVGTPSKEWGEVVTAYVTGGPITVEAIREHTGESLAPYKQPRLVHVIDELPRNALGKVQKHRLVDGLVIAD